jgi:hypothetical protein
MASRKQPALQNQTSTIERRVFLGIGDAVLRLIHVERMYADGMDPSPELIAERTLIVQALNQQYQLDLGMDCDMDGIPDAIDSDVSMITHAAQTSCCRILPEGDKGGSRKAPESRVEPLPEPTPRKKSPSRSAAAEKPVEEAPKANTSRKTTSRKTTSRKTETPVKTDTKKGGFLSSLFGSDEENNQ